jgi:hypothetical protein
MKKPRAMDGVGEDMPETFFPPLFFFAINQNRKKKRKCIPNINIERYFTVCGAIYRSITLLSAKNILKCKDASKFSNSPTKEKLLVQTWE